MIVINFARPKAEAMLEFLFYITTTDYLGLTRDNLKRKKEGWKEGRKGRKKERKKERKN
jgi:hypothetical protein